MALAPRPPLLKRLSPTARGLLLWTCMAVLPFALAFLILSLRPNPDLADLTLRIFVVVLPAGLLRRWPLVGTVAMIAAFYLCGPSDSWDPTFVQVIAMQAAVGYVAATRRPLISLTAAGLTFVGQLGAAFLNYLPNPQVAQAPATLFVGVLIAVTAWIIGNSVRMRREYGLALRERAVTEERLRIARELHDMISHSIGIIAIQAGVGGRVIETQPAEARNSLATIEATSRETLAQLRRTLGSLRRSAAAPAEFDPAPGLADLERLVASTAAAGVRAELHRIGPVRPVPADIDLSAYRIIQEALTNVVRHAGTDTCRVTVEYREGELLIEITDDGRGTTAVSPGAGFGIAGMRERVSMLFGEFSAGPRPEGGFGVTARLLLPS
ncbi:sensor histidine kinase [Phytomonospora endophytica]|uniref:histidine kinase n=1 Tax=Phytomonospora endophytica TaxID=714109 RepID=A0A841FU85_9ACTN|nr:sensor histidine kinase [Phytomonospora endophytica]MBB6036089.1 signal transduction histidine kinase [Phytomonospora endophytica]GIG66992.1 two-component sensor histidine kinase [Phytomonospora endophytica]